MLSENQADTNQGSSSVSLECGFAAATARSSTFSCRCASAEVAMSLAPSTSRKSTRESKSWGAPVLSLS